MNTRHLPIRLFQALILIALLCAAAVAPLAGQQAPDSALVAPNSSPPASVLQATAPSPTPRGPRYLSPQFPRAEPRLAPSNASPSQFLMAAGSHTITISTLALVLAVILIVVLVT